MCKYVPCRCSTLWAAILDVRSAKLKNRTVTRCVSPTSKASHSEFRRCLRHPTCPHYPTSIYHLNHHRAHSTCGNTPASLSAFAGPLRVTPRMSSSCRLALSCKLSIETKSHAATSRALTASSSSSIWLGLDHRFPPACTCKRCLGVFGCSASTARPGAAPRCHERFLRQIAASQLQTGVAPAGQAA